MSISALNKIWFDHGRLCQPHMWRDNVFSKVGHFLIALRQGILQSIHKVKKPGNQKKLMKLCAAQPASLPPLKILEQKAIAPLRGALTETSTKTTHRWNLQSPYYLRSRSSFQTIAFENPDWPTHPILCRLLKREISDFFSLTLCCNSLGCFT